LRQDGLADAMAEMMDRPLTKNGKRLEPIVDHIIPAHVRPESEFYDEDNLQTICRRHHAEKTQADLRKYGAAKR
jgi:5-methylcytosine-specific restriction endonuclease McrA